jgi:hypothetical protein
MKRAIDVGLFGELADPRVAGRLAARAKERGWDGFFVWDHIAYRAPVRAVADPWVTLAAVACATSRVRDRCDGHAAFPPPGAQGGQGDGHAGPAQLRSAHLPPDTDLGPWERAGLTWAFTFFGPQPTEAMVRAVIDAGPR